MSPADRPQPPAAMSTSFAGAPALSRETVGLEPSWGCTLVFLVGSILTALTLSGDTPSALARHAAWGVGLSLSLVIAIETRRSRTNVLRADLVCMAALYYLLFLEFLFPQPNLDAITRTYEIEPAIRVAIWSLMAMAVGRHCVSSRARRWRPVDLHMPSSSLLLLFWGSFAVGYFHMLAAVDFDPVEMVRYFLGPRFGAPWQRGRFGDAAALLYELGATIYLGPPLGGIILARRRLPRLPLLLVLLAVLFTLFYGFTTGTRSIMGAYLITFMVAFYYASSRSPRQIVALATAGAAIMAASTVYSLEFRQIGLSAYLNRSVDTDRRERAFFVDYNLYTISQLMTVFPERAPYLGWEVPIWVLVRVVPRALWPGKPDGVSISPETYLDVAGETTLSATFIGEGYMCAGTWGAVITGFVLGGLASWWTRKTFSTHSDFGILLYGSGFFAIAITMRSVYMLPVAILPTLAVAIVGSFLVRRHPAPVGVIPQQRRA
jgi:oligosaccharide repeat unit polymerase